MMQEFDSAYSKDSLIEGLGVVQESVYQHFVNQGASEFFGDGGDSWSAAGKLDHLVRAIKPLVTALQLPRFSIGLMFGKAEQKSQSYLDIRETYLAKLAAGAKASGIFIPKLEPVGTDPGEAQKSMLNQWLTVSQSLIEEIGQWKEKDLDAYRLPHPILGKLTVREMLLFTLYHNYHHLKS